MQLLCGLALNCRYRVSMSPKGKVRIKCILCGPTVLTPEEATTLRDKVRAGTFFRGSVPGAEFDRLADAITKTLADEASARCAAGECDHAEFHEENAAPCVEPAPTRKGGA